MLFCGILFRLYYLHWNVMWPAYYLFKKISFLFWWYNIHYMWRNMSWMMMMFGIMFLTWDWVQTTILYWNVHIHSQCIFFFYLNHIHVWFYLKFVCVYSVTVEQVYFRRWCLLHHNHEKIHKYNKFIQKRNN